MENFINMHSRHKSKSEGTHKKSRRLKDEELLKMMEEMLAIRSNRAVSQKSSVVLILPSDEMDSKSNVTTDISSSDDIPDSDQPPTITSYHDVTANGGVKLIALPRGNEPRKKEKKKVKKEPKEPKNRKENINVTPQQDISRHILGFDVMPGPISTPEKTRVINVKTQSPAVRTSLSVPETSVLRTVIPEKLPDTPLVSKVFVKGVDTTCDRPCCCQVKEADAAEAGTLISNIWSTSYYNIYLEHSDTAADVLPKTTDMPINSPCESNNDDACRCIPKNVTKNYVPNALQARESLQCRACGPSSTKKRQVGQLHRKISVARSSGVVTARRKTMENEETQSQLDGIAAPNMKIHPRTPITIYKWHDAPADDREDRSIEAQVIKYLKNEIYVNSSHSMCTDDGTEVKRYQKIRKTESEVHRVRCNAVRGDSVCEKTRGKRADLEMLVPCDILSKPPARVLQAPAPLPPLFHLNHIGKRDAAKFRIVRPVPRTEEKKVKLPSPPPSPPMETPKPPPPIPKHLDIGDCNALCECGAKGCTCNAHKGDRYAIMKQIDEALRPKAPRCSTKLGRIESTCGCPKEKPKPKKPPIRIIEPSPTWKSANARVPAAGGEAIKICTPGKLSSTNINCPIPYDCPPTNNCDPTDDCKPTNANQRKPILRFNDKHFKILGEPTNVSPPKRVTLSTQEPPILDLEPPNPTQLIPRPECDTCVCDSGDQCTCNPREPDPEPEPELPGNCLFTLKELEWLERRDQIQMQSDLTQTTSGFKVLKIRKPVEIDMSFEDALAYYESQYLLESGGGEGDSKCFGCEDEACPGLGPPGELPPKPTGDPVLGPKPPPLKYPQDEDEFHKSCACESKEEFEQAIYCPPDGEVFCECQKGTGVTCKCGNDVTCSCPGQEKSEGEAEGEAADGGGGGELELPAAVPPATTFGNEEGAPPGGFKFLIGAKGKGSPGLQGICCFDVFEDYTNKSYESSSDSSVNSTYIIYTNY